MGIETIILGGLIGASALSSMSNAKKQAKAVTQEGELKTANLAKQIKYKAAQQQVAFLNSGLTLDGTPMDVINDTYNTGLEDINQLRSNYNAKSKATISAGRQQAISSIISGVASAGIGSGISSAAGSASFGLETGGQSFFNGGFGNMIGAVKGEYGPGF